ncbi:MAG TPA: winged helix-turn-helix domain-containing protein [Solirubrobacterales bacterium]|nr:winged helix-turn-helix domain-containing protein [Solirubrobacterales bacterium]
MDPRFIKALDHPVRQHILLAAVQGEVSPNELSKALDEGLSQVSYHFKVLRKCGVIVETRTERRRGALEHYHRATVKTLFPAKAWRRARKGMRAMIGAGQASDLFNDLTAALNAGKLQGTHDHITRTALVLDTEGQRNVKAIAEQATQEVEEEQCASAERMEEATGNRGKAAGYTFALVGFEAAWEPADLSAPVAQVEGTASASANGARGAGRSGGGSRRGRRNAGAARK